MAKKEPVKTKKQIKEEKSKRWLKVGLALILVFIMIMVTLQAFVNNSSIRDTPDDTGTPATFNSIADALKRLPQNANYVRFVDLNASQAVTDWTMLNIGRNLPNASMFGVMPLKDVVASFPYPTLGLSIVEDPQVVVLSDFGRGYDNASYQKTTVNGAELRIVQGTYAFSIDSYPTISGRKEYVAIIDNFMKSSASSNRAYATYADLLEQANQSVKSARFAVAGTSGSLGFGDRYYAGVTPLNDTMCDYKIVIHLNQTLNETRMQDIADRWQTGASLYGIDTMAPQFKENYVVMSAKGGIEMCLNDLVTNWEFLMG